MIYKLFKILIKQKMKHYIEIQSSLLATVNRNGKGTFCPDFTGRNSISSDTGSGGPKDIMN